MENKIVHNYEELMEFIHKLDGVECYYRGYQKDEQLISSLGRQDNDFDDFFAMKLFAEKLLNKGMKLKNLRYLLALGQHYGIPTNLIDLTRDINIALYFGMGGEDFKKGRFNLIWKEKTLFEETHGHQLKDQNKRIGEMGGMPLADLEGLSLRQSAGLGEDVEITLGYLESRTFYNDYNRFFDVQDEYTFVPHKEKTIERLEKQNGLFVLAKEKHKPLPKRWFNTLIVDMGEDEVDNLVHYLRQLEYTKEALFPEMNKENTVNLIDEVNDVMMAMNTLE